MIRHQRLLRGRWCAFGLLVAYDGTGFHGFAEQPGLRTVGGRARGRRSSRWRATPWSSPAPGAPTGACTPGARWCRSTSRRRLDLDALQRSLTKLCGPEVAIREVAAGRADFDARFSARSRRYRYQVLNRPAPDPFRARFAWHAPGPLEPELLTLACDPFVGEHDFSAFCRRPKVAAGRRSRCASCGGCCGRAGPMTATACCASRSRPPRSATRWCAASWARSWPPGSGTPAGRRHPGHPRGGRPGGGRSDRPARGPHALAGRPTGRRPRGRSSRRDLAGPFAVLRDPGARP